MHNKILSESTEEDQTWHGGATMAERFHICDGHIASAEHLILTLSAGDQENSLRAYLNNQIFSHSNTKYGKSSILELIGSYSSPQTQLTLEGGSAVIIPDLDKRMCDHIDELEAIAKEQVSDIHLVVRRQLDTPAKTFSANPPQENLEPNRTIINARIAPGLEDRFALVLGGGGAKGSAQAGAILALSDYLETVDSRVDSGVRIHYVVGSSIGALNGIFVAAHALDALREFWTNMYLFRGLTLPFRNLRRLLPCPGSSDAISFEVSKVDLWTGSTIFSRLGECDILDEVRTSMAVPGLVPARLGKGKTQHVDGGTTVNLPISRALSYQCYWIVVMGMGNVKPRKRRSRWPWGQLKRAAAIQGMQQQQLEKRYLQACQSMTELADVLEKKASSIGDIELIRSIRTKHYAVNILDVPIGEWTSARSLQFSRKKCQQELASGYENALKYFKLHLDPLVETTETLIKRQY